MISWVNSGLNSHTFVQTWIDRDLMRRLNSSRLHNMERKGFRMFLCKSRKVDKFASKKREWEYERQSQRMMDNPADLLLRRSSQGFRQLENNPSKKRTLSFSLAFSPIFFAKKVAKYSLYPSVKDKKDTSVSQSRKSLLNPRTWSYPWPRKSVNPFCFCKRKTSNG